MPDPRRRAALSTRTRVLVAFGDPGLAECQGAGDRFQHISITGLVMGRSTPTVRRAPEHSLSRVLLIGTRLNHARQHAERPAVKNVLCEPRVSQNPPSDAEQRVADLMHQIRECRLVAGARSLDEISVHGTPAMRRGRYDRGLQSMSERR